MCYFTASAQLHILFSTFGFYKRSFFILFPLVERDTASIQKEFLSTLYLLRTVSLSSLYLCLDLITSL